MASNRQERRLERLRGAQAHQVGDLDFGIQISATHSALPQIPSARRTPANRGRARSSSARSVRTRPTPPPAPGTSPNNANISIKRRRLDVSGMDVPSSSSWSSRSRGKGNIYDINEDETASESRPVEQRNSEQIIEEVDELAGEEEPISQTPRPKSVRGGRTPLHAADEVTESPHDAPGSGQRRRQNSSGQVAALDSIHPKVATHKTPTSMRKQKGKVGGVLQSAPNPEPPSRRSARVRQGSEDLDELSPEQPEKNLQAEQFSDVEGEEAELIDDLETATRLRKKRKRKSSMLDENEKSLQQEGNQNPEQDEPAERPVETAGRRGGKPEASHTKQRQGKASKSDPLSGESKPKQPRQRKPRESKTDGPANKRSRDIVPIAVHRLTKPVVYGEDNDVDILSAEMPYTKRGSVNAVDVLAQICEEIIESAISTLEAGGSNARDSGTRGEYRTKLRAVEGFQEELRSSLFELTTMLDTDYALNKRVRDAQKEKIQLRQDLLRVRTEREKIALQMDEIRIKHEMRSQEAEEQNTLNTSITDIELAVSLGMDANPNDTELAPPGLENVLKDVAYEMSKKGEGGGVLERLKEFNAFLERAALVLEGRA